MLDCERCGGPVINLARRIAVNGTNQVYWHCFKCDSPAATDGSCVPHRDLPKYGVMSLDEIVIVSDYRDESLACSVVGCENHLVEVQHWAPKHLFPRKFGLWPTNHLCVPHHIEWHRKVTPNMTKTDYCPVCGHEINRSKDFDTDRPGVPADPFWGVAGNRYLMCQSGAHFHFRAGREHRYAYLRQKAEGGQGVLF
jgi:hypothetical protein